MGRSQFHKGAFDEAAATFSYMSRLYSTQPAIYGKARAWLAKCYVEEGWLYDAEDVIRNMQRDSLHWRAVKEWDYTYADYYIHTGEFDKAIPYLRKVIKHEMRRKQRAREWYLMGQLQAAVGNKTEAYKAFKHVIRQNPPYELEFNARISMTEVMATGRSKQMVGRLKRMAASDNNKEYLDQVYYAMGNIYLAEKDTTKAIEAYEKGNEKATRSGIEKGVLLCISETCIGRRRNTAMRNAVTVRPSVYWIRSVRTTSNFQTAQRYSTSWCHIPMLFICRTLCRLSRPCRRRNATRLSTALSTH